MSDDLLLSENLVAPIIFWPFYTQTYLFPAILSTPNDIEIDLDRSGHLWTLDPSPKFFIPTLDNKIQSVMIKRVPKEPATAGE